MKFFNLAHTLLFCFLLSVSSLFGQGTTITGNVYDAVTGLPLSGFVMATNPVGGRATTNASGAYTMFVATTGDFHVVVNSQQNRCYREKWTWGRKVVDFHLTACNNNQSRDSIALRSLYDNLTGVSWTNPWNITQPITTWGLTYSTRGGGPIEFVGLNNRGLNGTFPTAATGFSNLLDLFGFDFSNNTNLKGALPSLTNIKQLDWVNIDGTGMSGDPLSSIAGLKNLEFINVRNNPSMSVSFPSSLSTDWRNVYKLQLDGVNISGTIPATLFALPNIQTLGLGQNKLTGTVPALASGNSSTMRFLVLNDNDLDSVPNLSVSTTLTAVGVKGNKLTFDDIIPNITKFNAAATYENNSNVFVYAPQDSFFVDTTYSKVVGDPLSIDLKIDGALTTSKYSWFKNGISYDTSNSNKLVFNSLTAANAGVYTCVVTNPAAPLLSLQSRRMTVNVVENCATATGRAKDSCQLVNLYNATNGANWTRSWNLLQPMNTWNGVSLSTIGRVVNIVINNNNISGTLPNLDMSELTAFNIANCPNLGGTVPNLIFPKLITLVISNTSMSGSLPAFNFPLLIGALISDNRFSGTIPNIVAPQLTSLSLTGNKLTGTIPNFNAMPNLNSLYLSDNQLTGTIPNFSSLTKLTDFLCGGNQLTGTIPTFNSLTKLQVLGLTNNLLSGAIPNFNLPTLQYIALDSNSLSGNIPNFSLPNLRTLLVNKNQLSGTIPVFSMPVQTVNLSNNKFDSLTQQQFIANPTQRFEVDNNRLTFDDVINSLIQSNTVINGYKYTPQDSFFVDTIVSLTSSAPLSINLKIDGALTTNSYKWFKNGVLQPTYTSNINKLIINNLQPSDAGIWTCQVTNPVAPNLTLYSRKITLQVAQSCRTRDSTILVALYKATSGSTWTAKNFFGKISPWNLAQPITTWYGVTLNSSGCVESITTSSGFSGIGMKGILPDSITLLSELKTLSIWNDSLSGNIPDSVGRLSKLEDLDLGNNPNISGSIPNSIGNLTKLTRLYLYVNKLTGTIPTSIGNLTELVNIKMDGTKLNGPLPSTIGNLTKLKAAYLGGNPNMNGSIPTTIGNMTALEIFELNFNEHTGIVPQTINQLLNLKTFEFGSCHIDSLPNFSTNPATFKISAFENKLTFDDILPNINRFGGSNPYHVYNSQDSFFVDTTIIATMGTPLSINLKIDGALTTNQYKWFKNGVAQTAYNSSSNRLIINSLQATDSGVWTCQVTNPAAPLLTLQSRKITIQVTPQSCRTRDSLALVDLYNSTAGTNWTNKWVLTQPMTTWFGVTLNAQGCVEQLNLFNNNMTSNSGILNLSLDNLKILRLQDNVLGGAIPSFTNMPLLDTLHLGGNQFISLGNQTALPNLTHFDVSRNKILGSMPTLNLPKLKDLFLGNNQFSGALPNYQNLPALVKYHAQNNKLTGIIPVLTATPNIQEFQLEENDFDSLPSPPQGSQAISVVWLKGNRFTFDDIVPFFASLTGWTYAPQDSFFLETTINGAIGTPLSIDLKIDGALTTNQYKWFKNGVLQPTYTSSSNKLKINSLQAADAGVWTCQVTNSAAPLLTLQSRKITIQANVLSRTISGTLKDSCTGDPLIGASVVIKGTATGAVTDLDGKYTISVPPVNDTLVFSFVGRTPLTKSIGNQTIINISLRDRAAKSQTVNRCFGQTFTRPNGQIASTSGVFIDTVAAGCRDSIITTSLTIGTAPTSQTLTPSVCTTAYTSPSGKIYRNSGTQQDTIKNINGCDSIRYTINLTVAPSATNQTLTPISCTTFASPSGKSFSTTGTYRDTVKTINGCDSIRYTINLTIAPSATNQTLTPTTCTAFTSPSGKSFGTTGTYRDTIKTTSGCDSIRYLINLTVQNLATNQTLTPITCTSFTSPSGKSFGTTGTYRDTIKTINGCDSIRYLINLTVQNTATNQILTPSVCAAFTSPSGKIYGTTGTYRDTIKTINGCDSVRYTINLTVQNSATNQTLTPITCTTFTSPSGKSLSTTGTYRDTIKTINSCDSVRYTINLTVQNTVVNRILTPSVCTAYKAPSGKILSASGTYQDTVKTTIGCDSIRYTINLTIQNVPPKQFLTFSICPNKTYTSPSGKLFSTAGVKSDTLKNQNGCDSAIFAITLIVVTPQYQQATAQSVCRGDTYRGKILTRDTAFLDTLRSVGLCDSVITTTFIKVNNASVNNLNLSLCVGGSVTVNGIVYNEAKRTGQQILAAASAMGCDSIINISTSLVGKVSAIDDDFIIKDSTNTLTFNVLANDIYSANVRVTPIGKPLVGRLDTLGLGGFKYSVPPQANGLASFSYRLCSSACPVVCDTGLVKINIMRPRLNTDVSIGITPNCGCPNEKLLFPELELNPDKFPNNELVIISRWGDVVYRAKPYKNDWTGANENGEYLPAGTYYYIMRLDLSNGKIKTGDVTIYR